MIVGTAALTIIVGTIVPTKIAGTRFLWRLFKQVLLEQLLQQSLWEQLFTKIILGITVPTMTGVTNIYLLVILTTVVGIVVLTNWNSSSH